MKIEEIDKNLKVESAAGLNDVVFSSIRRDPFKVYGVYEDEVYGCYRRMPQDIANEVSANISELCCHTAGGRVRFATDSPYIAIRCKMKNIIRFPHITLCGSAGFDLYETVNGQDKYCGTFFPPISLPEGTYASYRIEMDNGYTSVIHTGGDEQLRSYTIHFPLYNDVESLEIGLREGARLDVGHAYIPNELIGYYGSSITQGGCASRPGNAYSNIISEHLNMDHINLGFSGSALGETLMAKYIAKLPLSVFVYDYDHNAPTPEHLEATHEPFFKIIREARLELPIIMITRPNRYGEEDTLIRREIIYKTYQNAKEAGDNNVYFVDGGSLFEGMFRDCCTVDGAHPNDAGFVRMANRIIEIIREIKERES